MSESPRFGDQLTFAWRARTPKTDTEQALGRELRARHQIVERLVEQLERHGLTERAKKLRKKPNDMRLFEASANALERITERLRIEERTKAGAKPCKVHKGEFFLECWKCPQDTWPPGYGVDLSHLRRA